MGPALDKAVSPIRQSASRLVPYTREKAMLTSKICREHASKCNRVAETIPRGAQREMFLDMARRWIDLAINIESTKLLSILHRLQTIHAILIALAQEF
jgi:hypothetical protein